MKALLRSSIFALFVFAGYAAVATDISKPHTNAGFPRLVIRPCTLRILASNVHRLGFRVRPVRI